MSDDRKIAWSMLAAAMLVMVTFAVITTSSDNYSPGPSMPEYGRLTYVANGTGDDVQFNGSLSYVFRHPSTGLWLVISSMKEGDDGPDFNAMPTSMITRTGAYYDTTTLETNWGEKMVHIFLEPVWQTELSLSVGGGMMICYRGAETDLLYHLDLVMPTYRASYDLTETNMTMIAAMDVQEGDEDLSFDHTFTEGLVFGCEGGGMMSQSLVEPERGKDYVLTLSAFNYTMYVINESDINEMMAEGSFQHDEIEIEGENSTALLEGDLYFVYVLSSAGYDNAWCRLSLDVIEES